MKILSAYKDYYDYLTGIYGEDPLLVLDRREHKQPYNIGIELKQSTLVPNTINKEQLWIGDYCIEFMVYNGVPYFGENIKNIPGVTVRERVNHWSSHYERQYVMPFDKLVKLGFVEISWGNGRRNTSASIVLVPFKIKRPKFLPDDVVVALGSFDKENYMYDYKYPILTNIGLNKFVPAETIYQYIIEYLSAQKLKAEQYTDTRTNNQKIEGKGFDKITSFRPNIKN